MTVNWTTVRGFNYQPGHGTSGLEGLHRDCKRLGAKAPITVGVHQTHGLRWTEETAPFSDVLSIHPYWNADSPPHDKAAFENEF